MDAGGPTPTPPGYTLERLCALTALPAERIDALERLGLLVRDDAGAFANDSVERINLARHATDRGVTDEQIRAFCRDHAEVLDSLLAARASSPTAHTLDEVLAQVPPEVRNGAFLPRLLELVGPQFGEPLTDDDVAALQMALAAVQLGFPAEALLQLVRVIAESVERVAEAENRVFHDYVHEQNRAEGLAGRELFDATQQLSDPLLAMAEPALVYMHRRALQRAMRDDFVRHLTEDSRPPQQRPGEAPSTLVFVDLAGFTPLTLTMGDDAAAEVLTRFASIIRGAAARNRGRIVKQIGDAFMLVFDQPADAVAFGVDVCEETSSESRFPPVHIGAHYGAVLYRDGDYVGNTVNVAARVAGATRPGQFLVTQPVVDATSPDIAHFDAVPPLPLKGIDTPVQLYDVETRSTTGRTSIDPVCGMAVREDDDHAVTGEFDGQVYRFCSPGCRSKFLDSPDAYQFVANESHESR